MPITVRLAAAEHFLFARNTLCTHHGKKYPMEKDKDLRMFQPQTDASMEIPLAESGVHAGFPSPADDFLEGSLDLNSLVVRHPEATFFARVEGDSMKDEGITEGDLLVVDKAVEPYDGCLAVAYLEGEFTLKRVRIEPERILLVPANPKYPTIEIDPDTEFAVWGVVSYIIKKA